MNKFTNRRAAAAAAVSVAILIPLGVFGAPALARTASALHEYGSGGSQYQYKVCLLHNRRHHAHIISVSSNAVKAHLRHGDTIVACPPPKAHQGEQGDDDDQGENSTAPTTGGDQHGKSGDHGKSGEDHGKSGDHGNGGDHGKGHG